MEIASADSVRQIEREGKRWDLFPLERDDVVFVAQKRSTVCGGEGGYCWTEDELAPICSMVDMDGFDGVLRSLSKAGEWDALRLAEERDQRMRAIHERRLDEKRQDFDRGANKLVRRYGWQTFMDSLGANRRRPGR